MKTDQKDSSRLPEDILQLLRDLISINRMPMMRIAAMSGFNRSALAESLSNNRSFPNHVLSRLLEVLRVSSTFELQTTKPRFWKVGADIEPLKRVLEKLHVTEELIELSWIPIEVDYPKLNEAFKGLFMLTFPKASKRTIDYIFIYREPYTTGRGKKITVSPENALPISPATLPVKWKSETPEESCVEMPFRLKSMIVATFTKGEKPPTAIDIARIFSNRQFSWNDIPEIAKSRGMTANDVVDLITAYDSESFEEPLPLLNMD